MGAIADTVLFTYWLCSYISGVTARTSEAVVMMISNTSICTDYRLRHLTSTAGHARDVWVLHDGIEPSLNHTHSQHGRVELARKPVLQATMGWYTLAGRGSEESDAAHFVAWLAATPYERAWMVADNFSLKGDWASLLDFDFASPADIIANTNMESYNTTPCTLMPGVPCASMVAPLRIEWKLARLSRRVATITAARLSNVRLGLAGPIAELVPAVCVVMQKRCRYATLNGSRGRPSITPFAKSKLARSDVCSSSHWLQADMRASLAEPTSLVFWHRFDIYIKWAYARVLADHGPVGMPACVRDVYVEHLRIWNGFSEATCAYFGQFHANCTNKRTPDDFVSSFDHLVGSMKASGFVAVRGASIPVSSVGAPVNGAHRVAAAGALRLPRVPIFTIPDMAYTLYRYTEPGKLYVPRRRTSQMYSHSFFLGRGLSRTHVDWVTHQAILANPRLHVIHLWPRAVSKGSGLLTSAQEIIENECAIDGGIVLSKEVHLSELGLGIYLKHAYGEVEWLQPDRYWATGAPMHVFVVASDRRRVARCKDSIRKLYKLPGRLYKAAVHVTDFHSEAIVASQMLLNDNSIEYMNYPTVNWTVCNEIAANYAAALKSIGQPAAYVASTHARGTHHPFHVLPESTAVDAASVLEIFGLGRQEDEIGLVWSQPLELGDNILNACKGAQTPHHGACARAYASQNPPTREWAFHNLSSPADLIHNPRLHGFCSGLKFVAPRQLLLHMRLRHAHWRGAEDERNIAKFEGIVHGHLSHGRRLAAVVEDKREHPPFAGIGEPVRSGILSNSSSGVWRQPVRARRRTRVEEEKARWQEAVAAHNATGLGSQYPWHELRKGIWEPMRDSRFDYFWKPLPPYRQNQVLPSWHEQLEQLPKAQSAGIIYMQIGSWPPWMPFLLASAAANTLVTFYFVGGSPIDVSAVCKHCTWLPLNESGFRERLKAFLGIELQLNSRRRSSGKAALVGGKLNDLKPAIGVLFPELAQRHKWIGFSDPDVILGNLSHEVSLLRDDSDLLVPMERFPEPLANGNFMLLRCTPKILHAFRRSRRWREVYQQPQPMAFDEWHFEGEFRHSRGSKVDRRYFSSSFEAWQDMLLTGELKPQPASRMFLQDAIIQQGVQGMYPLLDSFGARVNFTWRAGQLVVSRRGPCVCPNDVIPQLSIASCPQCVKHRGKLPRLEPVDMHGVAIVRDQTGKRVRPAPIVLDRTVEIMGVHFQMWKKLWRSREFRVIQAFQGRRPPPDIVYSAIPDCKLNTTSIRHVEFHLDGNGFSCGRPQRPPATF